MTKIQIMSGTSIPSREALMGFIDGCLGEHIIELKTKTDKTIELVRKRLDEQPINIDGVRYGKAINKNMAYDIDTDPRAEEIRKWNAAVDARKEAKLNQA